MIYASICKYLQNILSNTQIYEWTSFHRHPIVDYFSGLLMDIVYFEQTI